jgi:hypothetical protein
MEITFGSFKFSAAVSRPFVLQNFIAFIVSFRFFLRAILKELNTSREKFEFGKSVFYIFTLFLVQLLQSIFVGRYLCTSQLSCVCTHVSFTILQVWCHPQLRSRQDRHSDYDLPQDSRLERRSTQKDRRQLRRRHLFANEVPRQQRFQLFNCLSHAGLVSSAANSSVRRPNFTLTWTLPEHRLHLSALQCAAFHLTRTLVLSSFSATCLISIALLQACSCSSFFRSSTTS